MNGTEKTKGGGRLSPGLWRYGHTINRVSLLVSVAEKQKDDVECPHLDSTSLMPVMTVASSNFSDPVAGSRKS